MKKNPQQIHQSKWMSGMSPAEKHVSRSHSAKTRHKRRKPFDQAGAILEAFPESVLVCDQDGSILWINAAARKFFEEFSQARCQETDNQQFFAYHTHSDKRCIPSEQWLMDLVLNKKAAASSPENPLILDLPFGRKIAVIRCWSVPVSEAHKHLMGTAYMFHDINACHQKALHFQRVHEAVLILIAAISQIPAQLDFAWSEEILLLPPSGVFVAQRLVEAIHHALHCRRVSLLAIRPPEYVHFVAGSGYTLEQEQHFREKGGRFLHSEVVDATVMTRLSANQEAILPSSHLRKPLAFPEERGPENLLLVPLFLEQQWAGTIVVVKARVEGEYLPEEVELVKAIVSQASLVIECLRCSHTQAETQARALMQRLSNDFLTLTCHELRTPLTGIMGNLQLALQRLKMLERLVATQTEYKREHLVRVHQPLTSASQSAQLLQSMINDLIDDARIQSNQLALSLTPCDLLTLLKEAIARQQHSAPERAIVLESIPGEQAVPILADKRRITQVLTTYLTNALRSAPGGWPVTVELTVKDTIARVLVHDEGPGIPAEEQAHLWERFHHSKGCPIQHELDLSFGLGLYLCKALIERHQGGVGMQSTCGVGTIFWLTLPLAKEADTACSPKSLEC